MRKVVIIGSIFFAGLSVLLYNYIVRDNQRLYDTVKADFADRYPDYEFVDCSVGEGDMAVVYVHVRFKISQKDKIQEEIWQYWDTDSGWLNRDKYIRLTKNKNENK